MKKISMKLEQLANSQMRSWTQMQCASTLSRCDVLIWVNYAIPDIPHIWDPRLTVSAKLLIDRYCHGYRSIMHANKVGRWIFKLDHLGSLRISAGSGVAFFSLMQPAKCTDCSQSCFRGRRYGAPAHDWALQSTRSCCRSNSVVIFKF